MKLNRALAILLAIQIVALGIMIALPVQTVPQPASAQQSDKFDGECTGNERVGRCADKCPLDTAEGAYFVQGYDKDTGAVVCGFSYYNECPYARSQPANGDVCKKLTEQNEPVQAVPMEGK